LQGPNIVAYCYLFSLHLLAVPSVADMRTLVVLGMQLFRGYKLFKKSKTDKTFNDVRWMLTITRVAPECWDTVVTPCVSNPYDYVNHVFKRP
jgi:hypothetical protein